MIYTLEEVKNKQQRKEFLELPKRLYSGNRNWICPLDDDIEAVFDPARNEKFKGGDAIRWIARNEVLLYLLILILYLQDHISYFPYNQT